MKAKKFVMGLFSLRKPTEFIDLSVIAEAYRRRSVYLSRISKLGLQGYK